MNNIGPSKTIPVNLDKEYKMLEKMPPQLRAIITHAPYDYAMKSIFDDFRRLSPAFTIDQIAQHFVSEMQSDRAREALDLYGPTHPQAFKPRP